MSDLIVSRVDLVSPLPVCGLMSSVLMASKCDTLTVLDNGGIRVSIKDATTDIYPSFIKCITYIPQELKAELKAEVKASKKGKKKDE